MKSGTLFLGDKRFVETRDSTGTVTIEQESRYYVDIYYNNDIAGIQIDKNKHGGIMIQIRFLVQK